MGSVTVLNKENTMGEYTNNTSLDSLMAEVLLEKREYYRRKNAEARRAELDRHLDERDRRMGYPPHLRTKRTRR